MDEKDYDKLMNILETMTPSVVPRRVEYGIELYPTYNQPDGIGVEFTRAIGQQIAEEGYYISGMRQHTDGRIPCVEVWFDRMEEQ